VAVPLDPSQAVAIAAPIERRRNPRTERRRSRRWFSGRMKAIPLALGGWLLLRIFILQAFDIPSGSMSNTLQVGDVMMVEKALYGATVPFTGWHLPALREPKRGEILVFHSVEGDFDMVKRLVGMPGDTLQMVSGKLYRDGRGVAEPYAVHVAGTRSEAQAERAAMRMWQLPYYVGADASRYAPDVQHWGPLVVPRGEYFMMGDNRDDSRDSRYWGFLPRAKVVGKPWFLSFSLDRSRAGFGSVRWDRLGVAPQ
jgi:signal peptidase I